MTWTQPRLIIEAPEAVTVAEQLSGLKLPTTIIEACMSHSATSVNSMQVVEAPGSPTCGASDPCPRTLRTLAPSASSIRRARFESLLACVVHAASEEAPEAEAIVGSIEGVDRKLRELKRVAHRLLGRLGLDAVRPVS